MHVIYNEPHYTRGPHSIMKHCSLQSYCYSALNNDKEEEKKPKNPYPMSELIFLNAHNFVLFVYFPQGEFPFLVHSAQQHDSFLTHIRHLTFTFLQKSGRIARTVLLESNDRTATPTL